MLELILLIAILVHLFEIVALFCIGYVSILDSTISVEIEGIVEEQNSDREDELGEQAREINASDDEEEKDNSSSDNMRDLDPQASLDEITGS